MYAYSGTSSEGARTATLSGEHEFIPIFSGVRFAQYLVFCVVFLGSLFVFSSCFL
jgi:hypothetical protein